MYAEHYDLLKYTKFHHMVKNVERAPDYKTTGKWNVSYVDNEGKEKLETFDGVLLCNGHHQFPYMPKFEGQEKFKGRITHSHSYKDHKGYEDKVCVCVGVGNSGIDVAVELSRIAKQVYLVSRRGTWVLNKVFDYGMPLDQTNSRFRNDVLRRIVPPSVTNWLIERRLNQRFDHALYGLKPKHRVSETHSTVNDELPNRIISGTVRVKPNIKRFTESGVIFEDGTEVDHVDEVVLSTGYKFHFTLVEGGKLIPVKDNEVSLFEFMFPLETTDHNSLAIIGLVQPLGPAMPISEMQARVFFENLTGGRKLPSKMEMEQNIKCKKMAMEARYVKSPRHTIQVDYIPYMDELAKMAGCQVDLWDEFKKDPVFAYKLFCGPNVSYVYRLRGPHTWSGAKKAIEGVEYRTKLATCGSKMKMMESHCACHNIMMTAVSIIAALILAVIMYRIF
ncbi:hypothetical protein WR25_13705 [Diploscapter pachys]|uniref:Flavin-containing monooxygenase n=1 Tax=Diploscapter pachys TaxID=2018661 RepID=A0A2A2LEW2_9BILA|nr:hypothetical protein WR25_13705 [Diploscapter pachys]